MADQITTAFIQNYKDTFSSVLSQQTASRLRGSVMVETGVRGEAYYFDQVGTTEGQEYSDRHGDSPLNDVNQARRQVMPLDWDWGKLVDEPDKLRMMIDPASAYVQAARSAFGRWIDDKIIAAANGIAKTGKAGATSVAFPAGQKIAVAASKLTVAKLRSARELFGQNEADDYDVSGQRSPNLFIACSTQQIMSLLSATEVTSSDYNTVKALAHGEVDSFLGFKFIRTERNQLDGSNDELVLAWHKTGIGLAVWADIQIEVDPRRADKKFNPYFYLRVTANATRLEEVKVVQIACQKT